MYILDTLTIFGQFLIYMYMYLCIVIICLVNFRISFLQELSAKAKVFFPATLILLANC